MHDVYWVREPHGASSNFLNLIHITFSSRKKKKHALRVTFFGLLFYRYFQRLILFFLILIIFLFIRTMQILDQIEHLATVNSSHLALNAECVVHVQSNEYICKHPL